MDSTPLTPVGDGRDPRGRFSVGNRIAKGNPYARRVAALRAVLLHSVTKEDIQAIAYALIARAREGDVVAARELLNRVLGAPLAADIEERLSALEQGDEDE